MLNQVDSYAVVGNPIAHSKSPQIHAAFAKQTQQTLDYQKILWPLDEFAQRAREFFANGGKGLNVTVPFKEDAFRFADSLSERAKLAGAVNTLILRPDGSVLGDTTDGAGLLADLRYLGWAVTGKRILILGAGGAVRGVLAPLLDAKPLELVVANRTLDKASSLTRVFAHLGAIKACPYHDIDGQFELVINGTSAGLSGDRPLLPDDIFAASACAYDMMYAKELTAFLQWSQSVGVTHLADGLGMLVEQAAESFYLWRNIKPETRPLISQLRLA